MADEVVDETQSGGFFSNLLSELIGSPLNLLLLAICLFLLYKIIGGRRDTTPSAPKPQIPRLKKKDFALEQLKEYDGRGQDGRILIAVNFKVFDVTRGKRFYGPDGAYGVFAGRDASRGLGTFSLNEDALKDEYDDLSDLNMEQMERVKEWEMQFTEKYDYVGRLLKPGETPREYSDTEDEHSEDKSTEEKKKD
ncbi:membrane-associated progesterone receptor component 1-like [Mytilus edulis]|uniref:PGRMC1_2 n=1 Tax=Mytilus edulis TaxID=6550 RepID=A0A8S3QME0_MYTED|nr:PGRMC1_2 [Mytilus edulis]